MEHLFVAPDLPAKYAAVKVGPILIVRDASLEAQVREHIQDAPLQLISCAELETPAS